MNFLTTTAVFTLITAAAKCGIDLEIFENGDPAAPVSTSLETWVGKNFSLTCKIVNSESNSSVDNEVIWLKKKRGPRLENEYVATTNLSFAPVKLRNRGVYFCHSVKYGLYKIVYIIVGPLDKPNSVSGTRWKRSDRKSGNSESASSHAFHINTVRKHQSSPEEYNPYDQQQYDYTGRNHHHPGLFVYFGVTVAVIGVLFIVGYLLYRLMKRLDLLYSIAPERITSEMEPACHHPTCGQFCTFTSTNNSEENVSHNHNPYQTVHTLSLANGSNSGTPTLRLLPALVGISSNTNSRGETSAQRNELDLPPAYDKLVNTNCDKYDLPPGYNDAMLANRLLASKVQGQSLPRY